ncbi:MAG: MATE family efflux transporter [Phycisphaerae bacterium]|nr:MATE family efflux transporter [Phycisphaerae bacterium]
MTDHDTSSKPGPDSSALAEILRIAGPSVAAMVSYTLMTFIDKMMVSRIGPDPIYVGAQGSGGMAAWIPISFFWGALAIVNTFASQNLGAGKADRAPAYAWNALWLSVVAWTGMLVYGWFLPEIFRAMGYEPERVRMACDYGQIMVYGSITSMAARGFGQFFYGLHRPNIVLVAAIVGNCTNLVLNYVLIFGEWGFPRLELRGAAIATVIGAGVEALIPMLVFIGPGMNAQYRTRAAWRPSRTHLREIVVLGTPAGAMFGNEMICWGFFMLYLVGSFGAEASTAGFIAHQWMSLSFMPAVGLSIAVSSTVGRCMGQKRPDLAARRAYVGLALGMAYMGICGALFIIFRGPMTDLFMPVDTETAARSRVMELGSAFLIACAAFQLFDAMAMVLSGALRGAGDTLWPGVVTIVLSWSIIVGGGLLLREFAPGLGAVGPWIASASYIILFALAMLIRFLGGKWRGMSVVH